MGRDKIISVRVSDAVWQAVQSAANDDKVKPSEWLRRVVDRELRAQRALRQVLNERTAAVGRSVGSTLSVTWGDGER